MQKCETEQQHQRKRGGKRREKHTFIVVRAVCEKVTVIGQGKKKREPDKAGQ